MRKGFPNKILGFSVGWKDLGVAYMNESRPRDPKDYETIVVYGNPIITKSDPIESMHTYCGARVNIGKEGAELFRFCSRCLIKMNEK